MSIYEKNIHQQISKEINEFETKEISITDGFNFNQKKKLETIVRLFYSKFKKGRYDTEGFRKYYKNIVRNPVLVAEKAIGFNPSAISILPAPGQNYFPAMFMDRDFKFWSKDKGFSELLRRIFSELPTYGSVVLKKVRGKLEFVNLKNLINEQSSRTLAQSPYVIEEHLMSPEELIEHNTWNNIDEVLKSWRATRKPHIRILERRGYTPENWVKDGGDPNKYVRSVFYVYAPKVEIRDTHGTVIEGIVVRKDEEELKDFPYREIHLERIPGRWLGLGRVELNEDPQVRTNELMNLRVKESYFSSLNLYQTQDTTFGKNLAWDVESGTVLPVLSPITRIPSESRDLGAFNLEETGWLKSRDENSMSFDVMRGERLPAGTPLGSAQLAFQLTISHFDRIRENIAHKIKTILYDDIIPGFVDENNIEHYVKLTGEDLEQWNSLVIRDKLNTDILNFVMGKKKAPTKQQVEMMRASIAEKSKSRELDIEIPKGLYKQVKYLVDIVITGQERDIRADAANMTVVLQSITQDPTLLTDPSKRKIFAKLLESIGMNIGDIEPDQAAIQPGVTETVQQQAKGGGISAPNIPEPQVGGGRGETQV